MIAHKKQGFVQRHFFKIGIENPSEKKPEGKRGQYKFEESAYHSFNSYSTKEYQVT